MAQMQKAQYPEMQRMAMAQLQNRSQKKIPTGGRGGDGIIFAESSVGFDFAFVEYFRKPHFFGYPFSDVVKSNASIFGSPETNRFRGLLSGAFSILRDVQEYATAGIDVNSCRNRTRRRQQHVVRRPRTAPSIPSAASFRGHVRRRRR